jgi:spore maturation protein CgeB
LLVGQIASPLPSNEKLKEYDLILTSFTHFVKIFRKMGITSEYLPWCVEGSIPKQIGKKERVYDVVYVGGLTPHHSHGNKILEDLARKIKVDFWGYGEKTLLPTSPIRKNFHGQAWGKEMYEIFAQSKIVINRHINVAGDYANNMRMFEATAMGALLITDAKKNMDEFFKVGKEVVTYQNSKDLIEKVKYYLKHDKEREKIAKAGQKRTLKDHTYDVRMKKLDKILRQYLKS